MKRILLLAPIMIILVAINLYGGEDEARKDKAGFNALQKQASFTENKGNTSSVKSIANLYWGTYYGGDSVDKANCVVVDNNNDIIIGGITSSPTDIATEDGYLVTLTIPSDGYLVKFDKGGQRVWGTYLGGINPNDIAVNSQNELVIVSDSAIAKFTQAGMPVWSLPRIRFGRAVTFDNDGNVFALGDSLIKISPEGNQIWVKDYAGTSLLNDVGCDSMGNIFIAGHTTDTVGIATSGTHQSQYGGNSNAWQGHGVGWYQWPPSNGDGFIMKLDQEGTILWGTYYGGEKFDQITSLAVHPDGDLVVSGLTNSINNISSPGSYQPDLSINSFIIFDQFGIGFGDTINPECFFVGDTCVEKWFTPPYSSHYQDRDAFIASFTNDGQRKWGTYFGSSGSDYKSQIVIDKNKNVYHSAMNLFWNNSVLDSVWFDTTFVPPRLVYSCHIVGYGLMNSPYSYFQMGASEQYFISLSKFDIEGTRLFTSYYNGIPEPNSNQGQQYNQAILGSMAIDTALTVYITGSANASKGIATPGAFKTTLENPFVHDAFLAVFETSSFAVDTIYNPAHAATCVGATTSFHAGIDANPHADFDFQWFKNDQIMPGETDSVLVILNSSVADTGKYYCRINQNDITWWFTQKANLVVRDKPAFNKLSLNNQNLSFPDTRIFGDLDSSGSFDVVSQGLITYNDSLAFANNDSIPFLYPEISFIDPLNDNYPYIFSHDPACSDSPICTRPSKLIKKENGQFTLTENELLNGVSVWVDFDNDGRQEGFKAINNDGNGSSMYLVEYSQDTIYQTWAGLGSWNLWACCEQKLEVADYDKDGDLDILFVGTSINCSWNNSITILVNSGGIFQELQIQFPNHNRDGFAQWFDADADGDLDILFRHMDYVGGDPNFIRVMSVYSNDGGNFNMTFSDTVQSYQQSNPKKPLIFDFDNDGLHDIVSENSIFQKTELTYIPVPSSYGIAHSGLTENAIAFGDVDNDGDLDILGENSLFINDVCNPPNTPPAAPSGLSTSVSNDSVHFFWQPANDLETPQMGLTYNLRVGTTPGGNNIMSSMSDSTGWRKVVGMGNVYQNTSWWLQGLAPGTYYWSVQAIDNSFAGGPFAPEQTFEILAATHNISIPEGWSGLSSWTIPDNDAIESVFLPIQNQLTILQTMEEMYFPSQNINTIGDWENQSAYKIKVTNDCLLNIAGSVDQNKNFALGAGWNLIPVICNLPVDPVPLFLPVSNDLKIIKDVAGSGVFWPEYGINSLGSLLPGRAYFAKMNNSGTITFPQNDFSGLKTSDFQKEPEQPSPWGWINKTPSSHLFALPANITHQFSENSFIGIFTPDGICAGTCLVIKGQSTVLVANSDDPLTPEKEGFIDGEPLSFRIWDAAASKEYLLQVEYEQNQPDHSGIFAANGISAISEIQILTDIQEEFLKGIKIFPNPTNGKLNISGIASGTEIKVTIISSTGKSLQVIALKSDGAIDVSHLSTGVYFVKLEDGNSVRFEKVVVE